MSGPSDHHLLLQMHDGDTRAAASLWATHAPRLAAVAALVMRRPGEAADEVVQQTLVRVLDMDRATIKAVRDVGAWLTLLVRGTALNSLRSGSRRTQHEQTAGHLRLVNDVANQAMDLGDELGRAVDQLDEPSREVIILKHVAGLTFDQMAQVLEQPRGTIASRHRAAMDDLRRILELSRGNNGIDRPGSKLSAGA